MNETQPAIRYAFQHGARVFHTCERAPIIVCALNVLDEKMAVYAEGRLVDYDDAIYPADVLSSAHPHMSGDTTPVPLMLAQIDVAIEHDPDWEWPDTLDELRQYEVTNK